MFTFWMTYLLFVSLNYFSMKLFLKLAKEVEIGIVYLSLVGMFIPFFNIALLLVTWIMIGLVSYHLYKEKQKKMEKTNKLKRFVEFLYGGEIQKSSHEETFISQEKKR